MINYSYLYLLSPLHTGGTTQEGNLLGIARESHTELPYIPSSTIRGKIRSITEDTQKDNLFGKELDGNNALTQGNIWIGDGSLLWIPVPSLSHGVVWITCPQLLRRWTRSDKTLPQTLPVEYSSSITGKPVYLKDAIIQGDDLQRWSEWNTFVPKCVQNAGINKVIVLPDQHCATLIQISLWRQVKIKLNEHKSVDGGFRYEEAIPPDTLMYFPWGITSQTNGNGAQSKENFQNILSNNPVLQIGGQESLGRGFVNCYLPQV